MLLHLILSQTSLKALSVLFIYFYLYSFFFCSDWVFVLPCLPNHYWTSASPNVVLIPSINYSFQILYFSFQTFFKRFLCPFYVCCLSVEVLLTLSILPLISSSISITSILNSVSGILLVSVWFTSFSRVLSCSFIREMFLSLLFSLPLCVCFSVFCRSANSPRLDSIALHTRCRVGPSGTVSPVTWAGCSRSSCGWCVPSCCTWALLLLAHLGVELTLRTTGCDYSRWTPVCGLTPQSEIGCSRAPVSAQSMAWACHYGAILVMFWCCWNWSPGVLDLGPLGRGCGAGPGQLLLVPNREPPRGSYKVTCYG